MSLRRELEPCHIRLDSNDKRTVCGRRSPDDTPYCHVRFAEAHATYREFCPECWTAVAGAADTSPLGS